MRCEEISLLGYERSKNCGKRLKMMKMEENRKKEFYLNEWVRMEMTHVSFL